MMKKLLIATGFAVATVATVALFSCGARRSPGRVYMPDMTYSRAYETYAPGQERLSEEAKAKNQLAAQYSALPVSGTVARGDMLPYKLKADSAGYAQSTGEKNPLDLATTNMKEAERLYLINCGICHGTKLDGNGPLYNDGNGPFAAAPKNFLADDMKAMTEGTMFHSVTYGKGQMGSYASQLTPQQRWMVIAYVKLKQGGGASATPDSVGAPAGTAPKPDSATAKL
ncbi:MAG: cytochrome c [Chitinophagaceae bacterium]